MHTNDHLQARVGVRRYKDDYAAVDRRYKDDYAAVGAVFEPAIVSVAGQIHREFLRLLCKQAHNYCEFIGAEEEIGREASTLS